MNKKRAVIGLSLILAFVILMVSFTTAATNSTSTANLTGFEKSYKCLQDSIDAKTNKYKDLTMEELSFSLMALGYDSKRQADIRDEIESRKDTNNCWPKGSCTIKDTSQVLLAYNYIKKDTQNIQSWLLNQTSYSSDLVWYLQIDTANSSQCKITYDNSTKTANIAEDKTITGNYGACFHSAYDGYWLEISNSCLGKQFEITCNQDFLTSTFYRRSSGSTWFVSDLTNTAPANGKTQEKVESLCFKQSGACNYEGSLWATVALQKSLTDKEQLKKFLPYLITLYEDTNSKRFFPSTFLYAITGYDEYFSEISNQQNPLGFWQITDTAKRYYDTSLALWALYGKSTSQSDQATSYLLDPKVQGDGCWQGSIRDTAFVLYATSPKPASSVGALNPSSKCIDFAGYSCISSLECSQLNGNDVSKNFDCSGTGICCDKKKVESSCSEKSGKQCLSNEQCNGEVVNSLDTSQCCVGDCEEVQIVEPQTIPCTDAGNLCKMSCSSSETSVSLDCGAVGEVCCKTNTKKSYWWLWLLIILIIIVILAIIFKNRTKLWWFQLQSKFSKKPVQSQQRPSSLQSSTMPMQRPPQPGMPPMQRRQMSPPGFPQRQVPVSPRPFPKDDELDATLKKLKDM